jgi:hypothetical protein
MPTNKTFQTDDKLLLLCLLKQSALEVKTTNQQMFYELWQYCWMSKVTLDSKT